MTHDTASRIIRSLLRPEVYPHPTEALSLIQTHISWVILTGCFAYKIKKPVNFGFVDFSTLDRRRHFCEQELRLNRRFASDLYLAVVPITGTEHAVHLNGPGAPIEYALQMRQFDQHLLFGSLLAEGALRPIDIDRLADQIAAFHQTATRAGSDSLWGTPDSIIAATRENFDHLISAATDPLQHKQLQALMEWTRQQSCELRELLENRRSTGFVRDCHGDLHLGNVVLIGDRPMPFDCIEFSEALRWIDIVSEIAFFCMDLEVHGATGLAYRFLNRYQSIVGDYAGLRLWDFYRLYRAMVRAKVGRLMTPSAPAPAPMSPVASKHQRYLDFGLGLIQKQWPLLLVTHGLSGSGKSHLAAALCERLPAIWLRSDIERKRIVRAAAADAAYSAEATRNTYRRLRQLSLLLLQAGQSVIVDATFLARWQRAQQLEISRRLGVRCLILDLETPRELLLQRIARRHSLARDPSDATPDVLKRQLLDAEPLSAREKEHALKVDGRSPDIDMVIAAIAARATVVS